MKVLALGDPHGKLPKNLDSIIKKNKIRAIICVGEIAPVPIILKKGETPEHAELACRRTFKKIVDKLCSYNLPFLTLRGGSYIYTKENNEITQKIFSPHRNLYNKKTGRVRINGLNFIFFDMIWERHSLRKKGHFSYQRYFDPNKAREEKLNKLLKENRDAILLSHVPPYGYVDKIHSGKHVGSKILLKAIKKYQPKLVLCGHIHEAKGKAKIGKTGVYNLGSHGDYKILNF